MQLKSPPMTRQHYEFLADLMGPMVSWPSHLHSIADGLAETNSKFNRKKFLDRAVKAWEDNHKFEEIDDDINY